MSVTFTDIAPLVNALEDVGLDCTVNEFGTVFVTVPEPFGVWIDRRPPHCDRGRWLWHAESTDRRVATVDGADGFPRYFFDAGCLARELAAWLEVRAR